MSNYNIQFEEYINFPVVDKKNIINISAGPYKDIVILILDKEINSIYTYKIIHYCTQDTVKEYSITTNQKFNLVQPIGDNWLLVKSWVESRDDKTATIFDEKGNVVNSFYIGNGINHCLVDQQENIWIGYSEEGIFTSVEELFLSDEELDFIDWENMYNGDRVESKGIACFNQQGKLICNDFENKDVICDCSTINVLNNGDVLTSYYNSEGLYILRKIVKTSLKYSTDYKIYSNKITACTVLDKNMIVASGNKILEITTGKNILDPYLLVESNKKPFSFEYCFARDHRLYAIKENKIFTNK